MSAGLPGFGLGGIFFILSALLAPIFELPRTLRGRSSRARWGRILGHLALALAMIIALEIALEILVTALGVGASQASHSAEVVGAHGGGAASHAAVTSQAGGSSVSLAPLPVPPIAVTAALLAAVLALGKTAQIVVRMHVRARLAWVARPFGAAGTALRRQVAERPES